MTKEELIQEFAKLSKQRIEIKKKEDILKRQLITYALFSVGDSVFITWANRRMPGQITFVYITNKGKFSYDVLIPFVGHYNKIVEHRLEPA